MTTPRDGEGDVAALRLSSTSVPTAHNPFHSHQQQQQRLFHSERTRADSAHAHNHPLFQEPTPVGRTARNATHAQAAHFHAYEWPMHAPTFSPPSSQHPRPMFFSQGASPHSDSSHLRYRRPQQQPPQQRNALATEPDAATPQMAVNDASQDSSGSFRVSIPLHVSNHPTSGSSTIQATVALKVNHSSVEKETLSLTITSATDFQFLYKLDISQSDFASLKEKQDIKVAFSSFPSDLFALFQRCAQAPANAPAKFYCELLCSSDSVGRGTSALLKVVETNPFKNLSHISLRVVGGDLSQINTYLVQCLQANSHKLESLSTQSLAQKDKIATLSEDLLAATVALEQLERTARMQSQKSEETARKEKDDAIATERTALELQYKKTMKDMKKSFDDAARDYQAKLSKAATQLGDKAAELQRVQAEALFKDKRVAELEVQLQRVQSKLDEQTAAFHSLKGKADTSSEEMRALEQKHVASVTLCREREEQLRAAREKSAQKSDLIQTLQSKLTVSEQACTSLEERTRALDETLHQCYAEISKGNTIITSLRQALATQAEEVAQRDSVVVQQEEALVAQEAVIEDLSGEKNALRHEVDALKEQNGSALATIEQLQKSIKQKDDEIKTTQEFSALMGNRVRVLEKEMRRPFAPRTNTAQPSTATTAPPNTYRVGQTTVANNDFVFVPKPNTDRMEASKPRFLAVNSTTKGTTGATPLSTSSPIPSEGTQVNRKPNHNVSLYS